MASGDGIGGISFNIAIRVAVFLGAANYLQMELFSYAIRDTPFVPGTAERILRPLLSGVGHA